MTKPVDDKPPAPPPNPPSEAERKATVVRRRKYSMTMSKEQIEAAFKAEEAKKNQEKK